MKTQMFELAALMNCWHYCNLKLKQTAISEKVALLAVKCIGNSWGAEISVSLFLLLKALLSRFNPDQDEIFYIHPLLLDKQVC